MFERFTEPARRALFFARYETSQIGGVAIEPEHLLLGLAREGGGIVGDLFARASLDLASLHEALAPINRPLERTPQSQEIPFGRATLDVLRLASEEADTMRHRDIGPEHLVLGLLRQGRSIAFDLLTRAGVRIGDVRTRAEAQPPAPTPSYSGPRRVSIPPSTAVRLSRSTRTGTSSNRGPDHWTIEWFTLRALFAEIHDVRESRVVLPAGLDGNARYDAMLMLPERLSPEQIERLMRDGVDGVLQVKTTRERRVMDVSILTAPNGEIRAERESEEHIGGMAVAFNPVDVTLIGDTPDIGTVSGSFTMPRLCEMLEHALGQMVLDETHLTGTYRLDLRAAAPATLVDGLRNIGLGLTPARREVDVLVVKERSGSGSGF
jgi:uncharacterized protein (TIGR03435 family)